MITIGSVSIDLSGILFAAAALVTAVAAIINGRREQRKANPGSEPTENRGDTP